MTADYVPRTPAAGPAHTARLCLRFFKLTHYVFFNHNIHGRQSSPLRLTGFPPSTFPP
jgi:hypothetical protein